MNLGRHSLLRHLVCLAVLAAGTSSAYAQGFYVRELKLAAGQLNNHYETYQMLTGPGDENSLDIIGALEGVDDDFGDIVAINTGQAGSGRFGDDDYFEPIFGGEDYAIEARSEVTIPAGTWSIGFGSDDGGQLTLQTKSGSDIAFNSTFNQNGVGNYRLRGQAPNQVWYNGNRGHNWTGGTFTVAEETTAIFHSSFHERGGGDNFEVAIAEGASTNPQNDGTWLLLSDGAFGWGAEATEDLPTMQGNQMPAGPGGISVGGVNDGIQQSIVPPAGVIFNTLEDGTEFTEGSLYQRWTPHGNSGNLIANLNGMAAGIGGEDTLLFHQSPQWIGNAAEPFVGLDDVVKYPEEVLEAGGAWEGAAAGNQDSYQVWSSGQIELEEGTTKFRLGVDDYKYFAVDSGGNGVAGDQPGEVLLDDNNWLNPVAVRGGDAENNTNEAVVTGVNVDADGWYNVEIIMNEGGGGDAQTIFWDGNGNEDEFPHVATPNYDELASDFLVPDDKFRAVTRGELDEANPFSLKAAMDGATVNVDVTSDLVDADHITLSDASLSTEIDLAGATINVNNAGGDLVEGDAFVLFVADSVVGGADATWNYPTDAADWTNELVAGGGNRIIYKAGDVNPKPGDCNNDGVVDAADLDCVTTIEDRDLVLNELNTLPGDLNGDGSVAFGDFQVLSVNFGDATKLKYTEGDIDLQNGPQFADFQVLSVNFGKTPEGAAAAAVPEPAAASLIAIAFACIGLVRRRRR